MAGFSNSTVYADNVDFTGSTQPTPQVLLNGQLLIGSSIAPNIRVATLTPGPGVNITNNAGSITIGLTGGGTAIDSFVPDSGTSPVLPDGSGQVTMSGSGSITTVGGLNSLSFQLTGLTNHAVLVGAGTTTITKIAATANTGAVLQNNSGADPSYSTATYPSTTTINQILYSSAVNTVAGLATANNGVLTTGISGIPVITALASNGQLIIGSGSGAPIAATLTPGTGISITNAANSITIAATGSEVTWTDEAISFAAVAGNGYFVTANATATMPAGATQGQTISFIIDAAATTLTVTGNTGQILRMGTAVSASAGTAVAATQGSSATFVFRSSDSAWIALSFVGNAWTLT